MTNSEMWTWVIVCAVVAVPIMAFFLFQLDRLEDE